ncbi:MAG: hypothetical protein R3B72_43010 [Polyangiaceae bacterium]
MWKVFAPLGLTLSLALALLVGGGACDGTESARARLGGDCSLNSDCEDGLRCTYGVCHAACATDKDCPDGVCRMDAEGIAFCSLAGTACNYTSECPPPQVCGVDGQCRNVCNGDRDCLPEQVCRSATCAALVELSEGRLPRSPDRPEVGAPCRYSSECGASPEGLVLRCVSHRCAYACFDERDCGDYERCTSPGEGEPGNCELIGDPAALFCDPDLGPRPCACIAGMGTQVCAADGSKLLECDCP